MEQEHRIGRRLSAIVAADVAGYSRLMGLDEVGTARILREHRAVTDALVAKHGGRIVKTTGDGVLLEFPSVVDAVECAVAVQAVMAQRNEGVPQDRRMLFRIGINLGDVLIEGDDILGDGVNVAARLEGIAEPGGICISSSAHDQVRGKVAVEFADLGERTLKNIARPVRAYAVMQDGVHADKREDAAIPIPHSAPHLSIVVLPFANIGGDPEQEYFVDGVTESLTTDLSRINGSFVIARNTAFTFKGKGGYVYNVAEVVPIEPAIRLDKADNRFVASRDILDGMAQGQNLAAMDWQDFEHLIRELLAKEYADKNAEVKITRASRDRGVDAVIFNSGPLHGGKFVVQAKRYSNVVDVAAVRELYGTVLNEGANRGILVTTSHYGRDAYEWAANKPLTLIDGPNLLALLTKHGYNFKIKGGSLS